MTGTMVKLSDNQVAAIFTEWQVLGIVSDNGSVVLNWADVLSLLRLLESCGGTRKATRRQRKRNTKQEALK